MNEHDGYIFWPSKYAPPVGHTGLDIFLTPHRGERAFDTAAIEVLVEEYGLARSLLINYAANVFDTMHVAPGELVLHAHGGDSFMVLTFGGQLTIQTTEAYRTCSVRSTAPIFYMGEEGHALTGLMAAQMSVLMARTEARLRLEEAELTGRLSAVDPLRLMATALHEIQEYVNALPGEIRHEQYHGEALALTRVMRILQEAGDWPAHVPSLEELVENGAGTSTGLETP